MSAKIAAVVTYQNATTDIAVEYDSKNKLPVETVTLTTLSEFVPVPRIAVVVGGIDPAIF